MRRFICLCWFVCLTAIVVVTPSYGQGKGTSKKRITFGDQKADVAKKPVSMKSKAPGKAEFSSGVSYCDLADIQLKDGGVYTRLEIPGIGGKGEPGMPEMPRREELIRIPAGAKVSLVVDKVAWQEVEGKVDIAPVQPPAPDVRKLGGEAKDDPVPFTKDEKAYGKNAFNVDDPVALGEKIKIRDCEYVQVIYQPASFNPVQKKLKVAHDVQWHLDVVTPANPQRRRADKFWNQPADAIDIRTDAEILVEEPVKAQDPVPDQSMAEPVLLPEAASGASDADYLIITPDAFAAAVAPLAAWKHKKGFRTYVATLSEVGGSTQTDIKNFIQNAYSTGTPTKYVLLIGDHENLPGYQIVGHPYHGASHLWHIDYPYSLVSGTDNYPDLYIARLPGDTAAQITTMVNKTLMYDKTPDAGSWYDDVLIAGQFQDTDNYDLAADRMFMEDLNQIADFLGPDYDFYGTWNGRTEVNKGYTIHTALKWDSPTTSALKYGGWAYTGRLTPPTLVPDAWKAMGSGDKVQIASAINNGVAMVFHRDHGYSSLSTGGEGWGSPDYQTAEVSSLVNGNKLPFVFSLNCATGWFDECDKFAEAWIRNANGGAVGYTGAARVSYSGLNDCFHLGLVDTFWNDYSTFDNSVSIPYGQSWRPAEAIVRGKAFVFSSYGTGDNLALLTARFFNWFGDPELSVRTETPVALAASHPASVILGVAANFNVTVTRGGSPCAGALVALVSDGAGVFATGVANASGVASFSITPASLDSISVTVTERNSIPYEGTISVTSGTSPYICVSPSSLSPVVVTGSDASNQTFKVSNIGIGTVNYSIADNQTWLSVSPASGSSSGEEDTITVSYTTAGLAPGNYTANITVTDGGAANSPVTIPVTLRVISPVITVEPSTLTPSCLQGQNPASQTFTVENTTIGTLSYSITDNQTWLSVSPTSGASTGEKDTITVTYSAAGLAAGTYNATITITDPAAANSPKTLPVTLTVIPPAIATSVSSISVYCMQGQSPTNVSFTVRNSAGGTLNYSITDNQSWVSASPTNGTSTGESDTITLAFNTVSLAVGSYTATITITDPAASNSPKTLTVMLQVIPQNLLFTNFDMSSSLPTGWTQQSDFLAYVTWKIQTGGWTGTGYCPPTARSGTKNACLFAAYLGLTNTLLSPVFSTLNHENLQLTFWHAQQDWTGDQDTLKVLYSANGGTTWSNLASYTTSTPDWTLRTITLPSASANSRIAFEGVVNYGYGVCLDDIMVTGDEAIGANIVESGGSTDVAEGGATDSYTVALKTAPTANVTITITPDSQVSVDKTSLIFKSNNWNTPQTVTVTAVNDGVHDTNQTAIIQHTSASTDLNFDGVPVRDVVVNVTDIQNTAPTANAGTDQTVPMNTGYGLWSPSNMTTVAWYDAADEATITTVSGSVSQWNDKSTNGKHATQTATASRPRFNRNDARMNDMPSIGYDQAYKFLNTPSLSAVSNVYIVTYYDDPDDCFDGHRVLFSDTGNAKKLQGLKGAPDWVSTVNFTFYRDGSDVSTTSANPMGPTLWRAAGTALHANLSWRILGGMSTWMYWEYGAVSEIIITDGKESVADRQKIEGYLAHKWGLTGNLPENHPYKAQAPQKVIPQAAANLSGTATDPENDPVYFTWSSVGGPGPVLFDNADVSDTIARFNAAGSYLLRLTVSDGGLVHTDDVAITVEGGTEFTVTYDGNGSTGGTVPVDSSSPYVEGATVTVLGNTNSLVKTGYTFTGWNTAPDGSGDSYSAGSTFSMSGFNVTLYAQWTALPTYTVTYNGNGNTGGTVPSSQVKTQGVNLTLAGQGSLVKTGSTFAGWNTAANGSGTSYAAGATYSTDANVTLYAQWTANPTYTVTYNGNTSTGGTVPVDGNSYTNGATVTVLGNSGSLVKTGYTFAGWNTVADGSGTTYAPAATFAMGSANVTLYAQWTAVPTYTITYNGNGNDGGTPPTDTNRYAEGATFVISGNTGELTKSGYAFVCWNDRADGLGNIYTCGMPYTMPGKNLTLYAKYAPTYMVTAWPTATGITYGQSLSASALSGGSASVSGAFDFTSPSTAPTAGTYAASVTFTPSDTATYSPSNGLVNVAVAKATPSVSTWPTASSINDAQALSSSILSGGNASVDGLFTFDNPTYRPAIGVYTAAVTFTPTDSSNYNTVAGTVEVTVTSLAVENMRFWDSATTGTNWNDAANWFGQNPPTNAMYTAAFTGAVYNAQPTLTNTTINLGSVWQSGAGSVTVSGSGKTINLYGLDTNGIVMDSGAGALSISNIVKLSADQTWSNTSTNRLAVQSVNSNSKNLRIEGSGDVAVNGPASGNNAGQLTMNGTGTLTLKSCESFTSGLIVNSGKVIIDRATGINATGAYIGGAGAAAALISTNSSYFNYNTTGTRVTVDNMGLLALTKVGSLSVAYNQSLIVTNGGTLTTVSGTLLNIASGGTGANFQIIGGDSGRAMANFNGGFLNVGCGGNSGTQGSNNWMVIDGMGAGAVVTNVGCFAVAYNNSTLQRAYDNSVVITNGGQLFSGFYVGAVAANSNSYVGYCSTASSTNWNNSLTIAGSNGTTNSTWNNNGRTVYVGYAPVAGGISTGNVLRVATGGVLTNTSIVIGRTPGISTDNQVILDGGSIYASSVIATNSGNWFTLNAGKLSVNSITYSNGLEFVVGDGIQAGTLLLDGNAVFNDGLTVANGSTLTGTGTVTTTGAVAIQSGGRLVPGYPVGTLTVSSNVTISSGGKLAVTIDDATGAKCGKLAAGSGLNITGATLDITVNGVAAEPAYVIATYAGTLTGNFAVTNGLPAGYVIDYAYDSGTAIAVVFDNTKITPDVTAWPAASGITYGQALSASTLTGGSASVGGTFAFTAPSTVPSAAGTYAASVTFTPADTATYNTVAGTVNVAVTGLTVSYAGNGSTGGSVPMDANIYAIGEMVTVLDNTGSLVKTGYTFAGWNTVADGSGTAYAPAVTFAMGSANVTLYAQWTLIPTYTVTYNGNTSTGGTVPVDGSSYTNGATVTVLGNTGSLVKTGYTFAGWNTAANGSGTAYAPSATFAMGAANVILYAQWTAAPTYAVTYNGNGNSGGTVPLDGNAYIEGATVTVLGNTGSLTQAGYTFSGWNTASDGTGTAYAPAATFAIGAANVTLYAQWTAGTYTVSYDGNGHTGGTAPVSQDKTHGVDLTLAAQGDLVKDGYIFVGWNTASDGSGDAYAAGATYTGNAAVTMYAQWSLTLTLFEEDFESPDVADYSQGTLPDNGKWVGANLGYMSNAHGLTDKDGVSDDFDDPRTGNHQAYAFRYTNTGITTGEGKIGVLQANSTYTVTFEVVMDRKNAAEIPYTCQLLAIPAGTARNNCTALPTGSTLLTQKTGNATTDGTFSTVSFQFTPTPGTHDSVLGNDLAVRFIGAASSAIIDNVRVEVLSASSGYAVTYNGNGSTGGAVPVDASSYANGATVTVLGNTGSLVKTGYTFAGWNTAADGSGTEYAPAATFAIGANVTLYAQWTINTYTVSYNGNGSTGGTVPSDQIKTHGVNLTLAVQGSLVKAGYTFAGWNTAANGSGTAYAAGATYTANAAVTLYAQWTLIPTYTVTYSGNGSTGGLVPVDSSSYVNGATVTVLGNSGSLVKTGYTFAGWNTAANGSGTAYAPAATFAMGSANVTLYAQWTINTYTVSYNGNGSTGGTVPSDQTKTYGVNLTLAGQGSLVKTGYTFAGWNTAANGSGTAYAAGASYTANAAATLYAQWGITAHTITVVPPVKGTISPSGSVNVPDGANAEFVITPEKHYYISAVYTNGIGVTVSNPAGFTYTWSNVRASGTLEAVFDRIRTVNDSVPTEWLETAVPDSTNNFEDAAIDDPDGDGFTTAEEYWSGTDPMSSNSCLGIDSIVISGTNIVFAWQNAQVDPGVPRITVQASSNLQSDVWFSLGECTPTNGINTWSVNGSDAAFYRLAVTNIP